MCVGEVPAMPILPGVTVQTRMHGTDLGAMSQRRRRRIAGAGCKWALTVWSVGLFFRFGGIVCTPDYVTTVSVCAHKLCPISVPSKWLQLLRILNSKGYITFKCPTLLLNLRTAIIAHLKVRRILRLYYECSHIHFQDVHKIPKEKKRFFTFNVTIITTVHKSYKKLSNYFTHL